MSCRKCRQEEYVEQGNIVFSISDSEILIEVHENIAYDRAYIDITYCPFCGESLKGKGGS